MTVIKLINLRPSVPTLTPPPFPIPFLHLSVLRFTGIQSYSYTDQKKVEADVGVIEDRTEDL